MEMNIFYFVIIIFHIETKHRVSWMKGKRKKKEREACTQKKSEIFEISFKHLITIDSFLFLYFCSKIFQLNYPNKMKCKLIQKMKVNKFSLLLYSDRVFSCLNHDNYHFFFVKFNTKKSNCPRSIYVFVCVRESVRMHDAWIAEITSKICVHKRVMILISNDENILFLQRKLDFLIRKSILDMRQ